MLWYSTWRNYISYEDHWYLELGVLFFLLSAKGIHCTPTLTEEHEELSHTNPAPGTVGLTEVHAAAAHPGITIPGFSITCTCFRGPILSCIHFPFDTQDTPCPSCHLPAKCRSSLVVFAVFPIPPIPEDLPSLINYHQHLFSLFAGILQFDSVSRL